MGGYHTHTYIYTYIHWKKKTVWNGNRSPFQPEEILSQFFPHSSPWWSARCNHWSTVADPWNQRCLPRSLRKLGTEISATDIESCYWHQVRRPGRCTSISVKWTRFESTGNLSPIWPCEQSVRPEHHWTLDIHCFKRLQPGIHQESQQQGAFRICHVTCPGPSTLTWKDLIPILNMLPEAQLMPCLGLPMLILSIPDSMFPQGIKKEGHTPQKNWGLEVVNTKQWRIATENYRFFWMQSGEQMCWQQGFGRLNELRNSGAACASAT